MIVQLSPKWKFVCDRCGKEIFPKEDGYMEGENAYEIAASITYLDFVSVPTKIQVCRECRDDFRTFWENFRDSANKEGET